MHGSLSYAMEIKIGRVLAISGYCIATQALYGSCKTDGPLFCMPGVYTVLSECHSVHHYAHPLIGV